MNPYPFEEFARSAICVGFAIIFSVALHRRTRLFRYEIATDRCPVCRYPREGLPADDRCPECDAAFVVTKRRRETRWDAPGAVWATAVILLAWLIHLLTPYIWAAFYRTGGWPGITASAEICAYRCDAIFWIWMYTLGGTLAGAAPLPERRRAPVYTSVVLLIALGWIAILRVNWATGARMWFID